LENKWQVDQWVDACAYLPIKAFLPTAVQKDTGINLEIIFRRLIELVHDDKLELYFRVVCPNCFRELDVVTYKDEISKYIDCPICGEIEISDDVIFPMFAVNKRYKELLTQKKTIQNGSKNIFARAHKQRILYR
jgi:ribosomal protein S27E